jgi:hypothetical protein
VEPQVSQLSSDEMTAHTAETTKYADALMRSVTAMPIRTLMMPAKHARKKMKICWLLSPGATAGSVVCASEPLSPPPSHQSLTDCQYGSGTSKAT